MPKTSSSQKKGKQKTKMRRFFSIVMKLTLLFILFSSIFVGAYVYMNQKESGKGGNATENNDQLSNTAPEDIGNGDRINTLLLGVDEDGTRTDVMILASFDTKMKKLVLVSLPRDTKVELPPSILTPIRRMNRSTPSSGVMKLNEIHSYFYPKGVPYLREYLEGLTDFKIDHYIKVNFRAFRKIIDEIGGVEFDVPQNMRYSDPTQNLYINLKKGMQVLDGAKAEQLVRYRSGYAEGDLKRIEVQQEFMKEAIKQILKPKNILKLPTILSVLEKEVDTDFQLLADGIKYSKYLTSFNMENVTTTKIPGEPVTQKGTSYYIMDKDGTKDLFSTLFEEKNPVSPETGTEKSPQQPEENKVLKLEVLNGTQISGLASSVKTYLEAKGYEVVSVGNYSRKGIQKTVIQSKNTIDGQRVAKDLKIGDIKTELDGDVVSGTIRIVLGEDAAFLKQ